jgi:hypothetical protein
MTIAVMHIFLYDGISLLSIKELKFYGTDSLKKQNSHGKAIAYLWCQY